MPLEAVWSDGRADTTRRAKKSAVDSGYTRFDDGDILLPKITPTFEAGRVALASLNTAAGAATTEVHVLRARPEVDPRYVTYVCRSEPFLQDGSTRLQGVGNLRRVPTDFIRQFPIEVTAFAEQRAIANFLDEQTSRIDTLIDKQNQLIATLRERRAAVIRHAVTKGLNPSAQLRPSGLRWAGDVPAAWDVANIRRYAAMKTGHTPSRSNPAYWIDCHIPWLTLADVWQLRDCRATYLAAETETKISEAGLANSAAELLPAGTVVLSRTASVGFSGIMPVPMATSQDYWNWICGPKLLPTYLLAAFRAMTDEFRSLVMGSTHKTIYQPIAAGMSILVPPLNEQHAIVGYVGEQTSRIDALIAKTQEHIALAKERRAALITAAVTGQIDVRTAGRAATVGA
ncbi:restriction endonuclease subunit S [Isoptericola cucumis]|uniref:restriction endonuclease subunit S n=1 Tax=Isoptericola cucumis TaxID=1776856 RepID=UPI00320AE901